MDLHAARQLGEAALGSSSPALARIAGAGFIDAYEGPGGTFLVYASGTQVYLCTLRDDRPTMVEVRDLPGWSSDFAVPCARALAAGAIAATYDRGTLEISEKDSDRAYDSHRADAHRAPPPEGLLQRRLLGVTWGVSTEALDFALRINGYWNDAKTELMLLLGRELLPFKRMDYHFADGRLASVHVDAWSQGDWRVMESFEAGLRQQLPGAAPYELDGHAPWSAASSRSRLEGKERAEVKLGFELDGAKLFGSAIAYQKDAAQFYRVVVVAFPP